MKLKLASLLLVCALATLCRAEVNGEQLYSDVTPSFVAVQFRFASETIKREFIAPGVVVSDDGLIMLPAGVFSLLQVFPEEQLKDFKIIIPSQDKDAEEVDATFVARDERANVAFVKAKDKRDWKAIKFEDSQPKLGDKVYSVGMLGKGAAYKTYLMTSTIGARLRGESPQVLVTPGLAAMGGVVFNADGKAIGFIESGPAAFLNNPDPAREMDSVNNPPSFYTPANDFLFSLNDVPAAGEPQKIPWLGVSDMRGMDKELAKEFGLSNQPAIELTDLIADGPAAKAGLVKQNVIVKVNGEALDRPDEPKELPGILSRKVRKMKVGDKVTFSVIPELGKEPKDVVVTLEETPKRASRAKRYFAEDLGFVARELVFQDIYRQRTMPADSKGVVVALLSENGAAQTAKLAPGDIITQINGKVVTDLDQFKTEYEAFRKDSPKEALVLVVWRKYPTTESIRIEPPR